MDKYGFKIARRVCIATALSGVQGVIIKKMKSEGLLEGSNDTSPKAATYDPAKYVEIACVIAALQAAFFLITIPWAMPKAVAI